MKGKVLIRPDGSRLETPGAPEERPLTREQLVAGLQQLRAELTAVHRFNATFYAVMEEQHPGVMAEVIRRLEVENLPALEAHLKPQ